MKTKFLLRTLFPSKKFVNNNLKINIPEGTNVSREISRIMPDIRNAVNVTRTPMTIVPKGENATLMNFGAETIYIRNDELQGKIAAQIYDQISKVRSYK